MTLYQLPLIPEPLFLCNKSFHMSKGEFISRGSGRFPPSLSSGEVCQIKVAYSDLASSPLYTAFPWFSASSRGSQAHLLSLRPLLWVCCSRYVLYGQVPLGKRVVSLFFGDARGWSNIKWIYSLPCTLSCKNTEETKDILLPLNSCVRRLRGSPFVRGL